MSAVSHLTAGETMSGRHCRPPAPSSDRSNIRCAPATAAAALTKLPPATVTVPRDPGSGGEVP